MLFANGNTKEKNNYINQLKQGDIFYYDGWYYMKTEAVRDGENNLLDLVCLGSEDEVGKCLAGRAFFCSNDISITIIKNPMVFYSYIEKREE